MWRWRDRNIVAAMTAAPPFRFLFRVRYQECDAQKIVFNARWAEYVDLSSTEYIRALFGSIDPDVAGLDWKVVRQTVEWKASGRFDDVLEARVRTVRLGTTSFTLATEFVRWPDDAIRVTAETVYVAVDPVHGTKQPISDDHRRTFEAGAPGIVVDHAGALR
jgi:acyl-CoA thioester hydrolase